jgi:hypothetical protein
MINEICVNCGHAKADHHNAVEFCCEIAEAGTFCTSAHCKCESFTGRPDEGDDFEKVAEAYVAQTLDGQLGASSPTKFQLIQFVLWGMNYTRQQLAAERTRREEAIELIKRFRQWDHLDNAGDGPYWKRTIDAFLAADTQKANNPDPD